MPQITEHVDAVLVHRDQRAQRLRGQRVEQDQRARAAARIVAVRIVAALPVGQRLRLRQIANHAVHRVVGSQFGLASDGAPLLREK